MSVYLPPILQKHLGNISWQCLGLGKRSKVSQGFLPTVLLYLQSLVDVVQGVLGPQRGLEGVFDQGDVGVFCRVLNAGELLGHREEFSRHLAGIHQQHGAAKQAKVHTRREGTFHRGLRQRMVSSSIRESRLVFRWGQIGFTRSRRSQLENRRWKWTG